MKPILFFYSFFFLSLLYVPVFGQDNRLKVAGSIQTDSVLSSKFIMTGGTPTQILTASGSVVTLGSGLSISNGQLIGSSSTSIDTTKFQRNLIPTISNGSSMAIVAGSTKDTLKIPLAGTSVSGGLLSNSTQNIAGDKTFMNNVAYRYQSAISFRDFNNNVERWYLGLGRTRNYFTILGADSVGIGTAAPTEKLQVMGTVAANSFSLPGGNSFQFMGSAGNIVSMGSKMSIFNGALTGQRPTGFQVNYVTDGGNLWIDEFSDYSIQTNAANVVLPAPSANNVGRKIVIRSTRFGSTNFVPNSTNIFVENAANRFGAPDGLPFVNPITGTTIFGNKHILSNGGIISFVNDGTYWYLTR